MIFYLCSSLWILHEFLKSLDSFQPYQFHTKFSIDSRKTPSRFILDSDQPHILQIHQKKGLIPVSDKIHCRDMSTLKETWIKHVSTLVKHVLHIFMYIQILEHSAFKSFDRKGRNSESRQKRLSRKRQNQSSRENNLSKNFSSGVFLSFLKFLQSIAHLTGNS